MARPDPLPAHLLFVLTVEPATAGRHWRARLIQYAAGAAAAGAPPREFDSPLELARYVAQLSLPAPAAGGLR